MRASSTCTKQDIHLKETHFHDSWAVQISPEQLDVRPLFEALTSPENRFIIEAMGPLQGKRILDVGAGYGESSVYLALQGASVTSNDISPRMIQQAMKLAEVNGVQIEGVVAAAESLSVPENHFDFVYLGAMIHHVQDREQIFQQVHKALKPGGKFFSWDPLKYNPLINVYRKMATEVRTDDERPLSLQDVELAKSYFINVGHCEFWIATLLLFLKYYLVEGIHPNADRYWKRMLRETERSLWWWRPLLALDAVLTRVPLLKMLAWNMVMWGEKP